MNRYFSTFITGFQGVVEAELVNKLSEVKILKLLDGLIIYETASSVQSIQKLRFLNNSFIWLSQFSYNDRHRNEQAIEPLLRMADFSRSKDVTSLKFVKYFRVIVSKENQTIPVDHQLLEKIESKIFYTTHLKVHKTLPDIEFWFIFRNENTSLFGARITPLGRETTRKYDKGELRQEIAHLLVLLSEPDKEDVVIDPFAGSGAIVLERIQTFSYKKMYVSDIKEDLVNEIKRKTKWGQQKIIVETQDALNLETVEDCSVNKIITDPPWGLFERPEENMLSFYSKMLKEFYRILAPEGTIVILVGRDSGFSDVPLYPELSLIQKFDILVSGQKATVYKIKKHSALYST